MSRNERYLAVIHYAVEEVKMVKFELYAELQKARLRVEHKEGKETIQIQRPFYRDVLEIDWGTTHYKIIREGLVVRGAKIYKEKEYIGKVEEKIGFLTHFDVYQKAKKTFSIKEHETLLKQFFNIYKQNEKIGEIKPTGIYVPILSNIGKGIAGNYTKITKEEEEILLMAIIALGV